MKFTQRLARAWHVIRSQSGSYITVPINPFNDFWDRGVSYMTATGLRVSPETAMRNAAVFACVRVVSETVASLPVQIYRKRPDGGRVPARDHPLYYTIAKQPNPWQTSYEFWEMMQGHLELRGNSFAIKVSDVGGPYSQLIPVHPDRVQVWRLPSGTLLYKIFDPYTGQLIDYLQNQIFHLRGLSSDGLVGMSTIGVCAETIGCGLAAQEYAGRFFENDATPGGVMLHPKELSKGAHDRIRNSWKSYFTKTNQHGVAILEEGMQYQNIGITNKDSQLLEARQFSRGDIASMFRVPPHKIGDLSRATFSNIEQQNIEFATDCIRPRIVRLERKINTDLIDPLQVGSSDEYYVEFTINALMRGDLKSTYEAYSTAIYAGFMTRAEAREFENFNPIPGLDTPLMPLNLAPVSSDGMPVMPQSQPGSPDLAPGAKQQLETFVEYAVGRCIRKEVSALTEALKSAKDVGLFRAEADAFYSTHGAFLVGNLHISNAGANLYISHNRKILYECNNTQQIMYTIREIEIKAAQVLTDLAMPELLTEKNVRELQQMGGRNALPSHHRGSDSNSVGDPARETGNHSGAALP